MAQINLSGGEFDRVVIMGLVLGIDERDFADGFDIPLDAPPNLVWTATTEKNINLPDEASSKGRLYLISSQETTASVRRLRASDGITNRIIFSANQRETALAACDGTLWAGFPGANSN